MSLQERELPELRGRVQALGRELERLRVEAEEQDESLSSLCSEEDSAKACLQDVSLMDRYLVLTHTQKTSFLTVLGVCLCEIGRAHV